jgi:tripartite motif-containing protein 2/3
MVKQSKKPLRDVTNGQWSDKSANINGQQQGTQPMFDDAKDIKLFSDDFDEVLHAARAKYCASAADTTSLSKAVKSPCSYADGISPRWRLQRDDFAVPTCIAIASNGTSFVADVANSSLDLIDEDGNLTHSVTGMKPFSVTIAADDRVYVGDRRSRTIRVFDLYGSDVAQWDSDTSSFGWISGIACLRNGNLAIVDRERSKIGVYSAAGEKLREFGAYGVNDHQLCMADFVAVDSHDRIIVADSGNHCLKLFDSLNGKLIACYSTRGTDNGCLLWPKGVAVDCSDNIIVADNNNDRISQFAADGQFIGQLLTSAPRPYHVTCSSNNLLGVTHFALSGMSQIDVYFVEANSSCISSV